MSGFGDDDPDDAYDASDPLEVRAAVAARVLTSIVAESATTGPTVRVLARLAGWRRMVDAITADLEEVTRWAPAI